MIENIYDEEHEYQITLKIDPDNEHFKAIAKREAYYINIDESGVLLCAADEGGALYAAQTFADIIHKEGSDIFIPKCVILDYPDFERRGHFMECRYGSEFMTKEDWFGVIDDMAKMKLNQLTIALYGCWKLQYDGVYAEYLYIIIKKYPFLKTLKNIKYYSVLENKWIYKDNLLPSLYEGDFLGEIIAYGKKKNVTVKPLFNSLGHNSLIPRLIPETSAKKENGESTGFGFCTQNEKTYEVMFTIYDEIIERYLKPNGADAIEIGLDEVWDPYIYHDMLFHDFDIVNEELRQRFIDEGIYDEVVLDWWSYEAPERIFLGRADDVNNLFRSVAKPMTGYYNWCTPTENNDNIRAVAAIARKHNFEGIESYSSFEHSYDKNYLTIAEVSWNKKEIEKVSDFEERYAYRYYPENTGEAIKAFNNIKEAMNKENDFMNPLSSRFEYYDYCYYMEGKPYPQNFPGVVYEMIEANEAHDVPYLEFLKTNSQSAAGFFENSGRIDRMNDIWLINAKHYFITADEYLTLYDLYKRYNREEVDAFKVVSELERLILQREKLMKLIELTRIPATAHTYLRNMSVYRQYMIALKDYFKKELAAGRRPMLELKNLSYANSPETDFLR